jgi:hypothetical protein
MWHNRGTVVGVTMMSGFGRLAQGTYRTARRIAVAVVGGTLVLIGVVMIVAPGPAFVVIPLGLGVLAIEFTWAKRWLERVRSMIPSRSPRETAGERAVDVDERDRRSS